jgi:hypothetical protein
MGECWRVLRGRWKINGGYLVPNPIHSLVADKHQSLTSSYDRAMLLGCHARLK